MEHVVFSMAHNAQCRLSGGLSCPRRDPYYALCWHVAGHHVQNMFGPQEESCSLTVASQQVFCSFFPSAKWSNDHIACFCRVKSIGHIGHLRLNDPGSLSICLLNLLQNVQYMCWFASVPQKFSKLFAFFFFQRSGVKWSHGTCFYRVPEHCSHWSPEAEHSSNISSVAEGTRTFLMDRFLGMEWQGWYLGTRFPAICRKSPRFRLPAGRIGYQCVLKLSTTTVHHTQPQMSF